MNEPTVSVVMATLNAASFLSECLDSVVAQTSPPHEIIVVDGGSEDATVEIARSFPRTRVLRQVSEGFAPAWNEGIRAASGSLIALIDADDRWTASKLRRQLDRLEGTPRVDVVLGHVRFFLTGPPPPHFRPELLGEPQPAYMPGALLARRRVFDQLGAFGEQWKIASDVDWFARLLDSGIPLALLDEVVLEKRVHDSNLSYTTARTPTVRREILAALRDSIRRKRRLGPAS